MKLRHCLILAGVLLTAVTHAQKPAETNTAGVALHALFDREWEWELTQDPLWASYLGDRRWNDRWEDISLSALAARQAHRESVLKDLAAIPRDQLSPADRLNYDLFRHQYQMVVEGFQHRQHLIRTSTLSGVQGTEFIVDSLRFQTVKDFDDWLARLDAFPALHGSEHRADARGHEDQRAAAEDHRRARAPADRAAGHAAARPERLLPPVPHHSWLAACGRSRAPREGWCRARPLARAAGVCEAARVHGSRVPEGVLRRRRLVAHEQRARGLSLLREVPHDDRSRAAGDSRARAEGSGAHPRRDGDDQEAGRLHRARSNSSSRTCGPIRSSSTRPAKSCSTAIAPSQSGSIPSSSRSAASCRARRTASSRFPTPSRRCRRRRSPTAARPMARGPRISSQTSTSPRRARSGK